MSEVSKKRITAGAGLGLGAILALPATATAEDVQVTNLNDSGAGSLREALNDTNSDPDADRVLFKSKLSGEISLQDNLFIVEPVSVIGPGARRVVVDGGDGPMLPISPDPGEDVAISGLTLTNAHARPLAATGGAIFSGGADLTLSRMAITGNQADSSGGGVAAFGGSLTIESSTISGNTALGSGGGIYAYVADLSIQNSTITGNSAEQYGGGAYFDPDADETFELRNSTVTANSAEAAYGGGGLYETGLAEKEIFGSIVAGNTADVYPDLDDGPWATSFSLIGNTTDDGGSDPIQILDGGGSLLNVDPKLKPLKDNGGPTDTHAFRKSPAKNAGPSDAPDKDQRGAPRKGQADIGAYEFTKCKGVIVNRVGTSGKDKLKGTKRKDGMLGLGGNDKLKGKKGKDGLCGGRGKDKLIGGPGKDKFNGGPGNDKEVQ